MSSPSLFSNAQGVGARIRIAFASCLAALALQLCAPTSVAAQNFTVHTGFYSAEIYREQPPASRTSYVLGVYDTVVASTMFGAPFRSGKWLNDCTAGWSGEQLLAIVDRFVAEHPERWQSPMAVVFVSALDSVCPGRLRSQSRK